MNFSFLEKLCLTVGISGDEAKVRELIINEIKPYANTIELTPLGDIIAEKKGRATPKKKLMLAAHMDEVGLIINNITEDGYFQILPVGGVNSDVLLGKTVYVNGETRGVIGGKPVHLMKGDEFEKIIPMDKLTVDVGAPTREEAEKVAMVGDYINFEPFFAVDNGNIMGKSLDDRIGCFILTELIKSDLPYDITFAFTTCEEVGCIGGKAASYKVNPDLAIAVEGTVAGDVLENKGPKVCTKLGLGAAVSIVDRGTVYDREFFKLAFAAAKELDISCQPRTSSAGSNDASAMHSARTGARAAAVSVPCRYIHSPTSLARVSDLESAMTLIPELAKRMLES